MAVRHHACHALKHGVYKLCNKHGMDVFGMRDEYSGRVQTAKVSLKEYMLEYL